MFRESICSSTGIANKSHGLCFCACSPCPRRVFDFWVSLPQAQENMACPCWLGRRDGHPCCGVAAGECTEWECWVVFVPRQSPSSGGWALLSPALWLPFQQSGQHWLVLTEAWYSWCVFGVLPHHPGKVYSVASAWQRGLLGSKQFRRLKVVYLRGFLLPTVVTHII